MEIKDAVGTGAVILGVAAGMAVGQNQVDIRGSARPEVQQSTSTGTTTTTTTATAGLTIPATRVGFVESTALTMNRTVDGSYVTGFLLTNPECGSQTISLSPQLFDRNNEPLPVTLSMSRGESNIPMMPSKAAAAGHAGNQPSVDSWVMAAGEYVHVTMNVGPKVTAERKACPFADVWAALRSAPMHYGYWTGHLPAAGLLILTRHTPASTTDTKTGACKPPAKTSGGSPTRITRPLALQPPLPAGMDAGVLLASLGLALLATLIAAVIIGGSTKALFSRMGDVAFDVKTSWGANVAVGGAVVTALMTTATLAPDQYSTNSGTYLVLAGIFAALVPMGATLYGLIRPQAGVAGPSQEGYVSIYLLSSGLILWGAFGQFLLLGLFFRELGIARVLSPVSAEILIVVTKAMLVFLMGYAVMTALATVQKATTPVVATAARPPAAMI